MDISIQKKKWTRSISGLLAIITQMSLTYYTLLCFTIQYIHFQIHTNPDFLVAESDYSNNEILCQAYYNGFQVVVGGCRYRKLNIIHLKGGSNVLKEEYYNITHKQFSLTVTLL